MLALDGVHFAIGDRERCLRFSWAALIALHDHFGDGFEEKVANAIIAQRVDDLATIVVLTSGVRVETRAEFEAARRDVIAANPPLKPLCSKLEIAWAYAYHGFEAAKRFQEVAEKETKALGTATTPKKSIRSRFTSAFATLMRTLSGAT
jgi:hypothetical protein